MNRSLVHATLAVFASVALGQDFDRIAPQLPPPEAAVQSTEPPAEAKPGASTQPDATLIKNLRGLRFIANPADVQEKGLARYTGIAVEPSVSFLIKNPRFAKQLGEAFIDKPLTRAKLELLRREVITYYQDKGHPVVVVTVPPQDVTEGVLQLIVTEARVGEVRVEGNHYFKSERISGQVRVEPGQTITTGRLLADVAQLNQNPFRNVDVVFEPGKDPGTTNVILRTTDRRPFRVYAGYDDTGVDVTGRDRWFAGFNWGDAFFADGVLSYQHTTSSDFHSMTAESLTYTQVLPWHHVATLFGSYGRVNTETLDSMVDSNGETFQLGLRYTIPMSPQSGKFVHALVLGFDFKQTNNDLAFGGQSVSSTKINVGQFMAGYNASYKTTQSSTTLGIEGYYNPGSWVGNDSTADYQELRSDAKSEYGYIRGTLTHTQRLPKEFSAIATFTGQLSTGNLIPTETFGIGGFGTVRGYDERIINADQAFLASAELRSPTFAPLRAMGVKKANDQLQFLAFVDYGIAGNKHLLPDERSSQQLLSVGPGLRYSVNDWLTLRLDYGFALKSSDTGSDDSRIHLSATISY